MTSIYHNLDSISEPLAQQQLLKALVVLGHQYSEEVVTTLLGCSLSCDRYGAGAAAACAPGPPDWSRCQGQGRAEPSRDLLLPAELLLLLEGFAG